MTMAEQVRNLETRRSTYRDVLDAPLHKSPR